MDNVLDLFDQTVFLGERATGATNLLQCVWIYNRAIDLDGLRRFHRHLAQSRLSRRIEPSPLPFGRHRWIAPTGQSDLEIVASPRSRDELDAWLQEQADTPVDAERGPGWHLAVLQFIDGGAAVSLVISHCLTDGVGLCEALADAATGRHDPITWPAAGSRGWWRAVREDARQTARDLPGIGRAVAAAARMARRNSANAAAAPVSQAPAGTARTDERITLPTATIFVDADEWEARAASLGGTSNTMLAGLAAQLAQRIGRVAADGSVDVTMPVNERTQGDTRANAITNVDFTVDPAPATTDLSEIRAAIKQALIRSADETNVRWQLLHLAPLLPQWLVRRCVGISANGAASVISSNLGVVDPASRRPDGTDADHFVMKPLGPGVTKSVMHRLGGLLVLLSGRTNGRVFVSVLAYQPGRPNSNDTLGQDLSTTLRDFALTATIGWPRPVSAAGLTA
ncbi:wax ester/triacylglycerol synthase domain-containing protein [Mycobacterium sp. HNNTM2301]|uniref:wax ester/triacylglycerol synthase domain-containing protein n=1 Tax=Mycobacterium hainanense TaxID=3289775 RepID=UPI0035A5A9C0